MVITNRSGLAIKSLADWETLGKPASAEHWKPGRSAYELARDWTEGGAEDAVVSLLSVRPELVGIALVDAVAEKRTQFDEDPHGPRNHDLLIRGLLPHGQSITVGVEGKADEPFDVPIWRYREKGLRRSKDTGALDRIDSLVRRWFQTSLAADRTDPPLVCLGYQLFSSLAGTLADAKVHGSSYAIVLIMEYVTDLTDDAEHAHNARTLENFLARLIGAGAERAETSSGWVTTPHPVQGDGVWSARTTEVSFAKLVRNLRTGALPVEA
jgi:hypothetical protein